MGIGLCVWLFRQVYAIPMALVLREMLKFIVDLICWLEIPEIEFELNGF